MERPLDRKEKISPSKSDRPCRSVDSSDIKQDIVYMPAHCVIPAAHFLQKPHISKVSRLGLNIHLEVTVFLCHSGLFCSNPLIEDNTYLGRCDRFFLSNASYL